MPDRPNILLVDDDPNVIALLGRTLSELGSVRFATNGLEALRLAREFPPDLVLLDVEMPEMDGFELCSALKGEPNLGTVPVIFLTCHDAAQQEATGLALGAVDFISKPPNPPLVTARVRTHLRLKHVQDDLRQEAATDPLTGLPNRRHFDERLRHEWLRALRAGSPISLLMVDIDHFKEFNDHYGHQAGDRCLRQVAEGLREAVKRSCDQVIRFGGEEFAIILPDTDGSGARKVASNVVKAIRALKLPHGTSEVDTFVTVSCGAATWDEKSAQWDESGSQRRDRNHRLSFSASDLLSASDQALYRAKALGRNRLQWRTLDEDSPVDQGSPPAT
ncbi:MAG: diguanylate cyclase [Fibrobacteria bacterium]|nr:diguanylate cyclase [Fibrobacteria bacterium]